MNLLSQLHNVGIQIDHLSNLDNTIDPIEDYKHHIDIARGPEESEIIAMLSHPDGSHHMTTRMYRHAEALQKVLLAAAKDGVMLTVAQIPDPHKTVPAINPDQRPVPALGAGFGMSLITARMSRQVCTVNYNLIRERERLANFKLAKSEPGISSYAQEVLESDIVAGLVATGKYPPVKDPKDE